MTQHSKKKHYHIRYSKMISNLDEISMMMPEEKYMFRLMDTVIFQDFETALEVVIEDFKAANDNKK